MTLKKSEHCIGDLLFLYLSTSLLNMFEFRGRPSATPKLHSQMGEEMMKFKPFTTSFALCILDMTKYVQNYLNKAK